MYSFRYYVDSWIELSSQPSSSSLSSAGAPDEIVTTGLRVQQLRRRRAAQHHHHHHGGYHVPPQDLDIAYSHRPSSATGSSQDENEETESESDRVSNDDFPTRLLRPDINMLPEISSQSDEQLSSDDEDDTSTALGFNPQPNAFSHPPASIRTAQSRSSFDSARLQNRSSTRRNSRSSLPNAGSRRASNQHPQHSPFNIMSPSHQADHDAALRASLSTLLSCAAAARGLPKNDSQPSVAERSPPRAEPSTFRLLPGATDTEDEPIAPTRTHQPPRFISSTPVSPRRSRSPISAGQKTQRKASPSKDRSVAKKARRPMATETSQVISPTVMTWVISAGVVVLFSAISFSAGYVLGREVGRIESGHSLYGNGISNISEPGSSGFPSGAGCGREAVKGGLGRFRWSGGSVSA
ncbi:uncharacterized protein GIQ15_04707 [Arthroderma uncinatum]|uniref:uncharacterized protein n=1 Tax=Arthroderma uncinatum TaxID=74035 RepID=UPI00144ABC52|nr:uncharacterized protein GIQ15_04707 [Arthroderma uncinatum]KAF3481948.1 hypothetical protein GIQ15_04707 [Arthroderma uncinatum]